MKKQNNDLFAWNKHPQDKGRNQTATEHARAMIRIFMAECAHYLKTSKKMARMRRKESLEYLRAKYYRILDMPAGLVPAEERKKAIELGQIVLQD